MLSRPSENDPKTWDPVIEDLFRDNKDMDDEFPCRPCSRLSFNQEDDSEEIIEETSDSDESDSDFVAHLLQKSRVLEKPSESLNPPTLKPQRTILTRQNSFYLDTESLNTSPSIRELSSDSPFNDSQFDPSSLEDFHKPTGESEDWSVKPKFSCLPSPLSSHHYDKGSYTYRYTPPRHCYGHHGLSRHALQHSKWFWAVREEVWLERKVESDPFEDPILPFKRWSKPIAGTPYSEPDSPSIPHFPPGPLHPLPPLTVHPRRGDLHSLRDPYSMHIDRYFVGMPLWTMSKTLWMFDVHMATARGPMNCLPTELHSPGIGTPIDEDDSQSCASMSRSDSTGFSDDSDSTLVGSDNEGEISPTADEDILAFDGLGSPRSPLPKNGPDVVSLSTSKVDGHQTGFDVVASGSNTPLDPSSPVKPKHLTIFAGWPQNWYRRWEVLLHLCFKNNTCPSDSHVSPPVTPSKPSKKKPKFFVCDDEEETWSDVLLKPDDESKSRQRRSEKVLFVVNRVADDEGD